MIETETKTKPKFRYEPIERRHSKRRGAEADRRAEARNDAVKSDRRQRADRREK